MKMKDIIEDENTSIHLKHVKLLENPEEIV